MPSANQGFAERGSSTEIDALQARGVALYEADRLAEAEQACAQILARDPQDFGALLLLGVLAIRADRLEAAEDSFSRAVAVNATAVEAQHNLGVVQLARGRTAEAATTFRRVATLRPDSADAFANLGDALHRLGRCEDALQSYDRATALAPGAASCHSRRAAVLLELGRAAEALLSCDRAIGLDPTSGSAHLIRAGSLRQCARHTEALFACERAVKLMPDRSEAYASRGMTLAELGRHEEALRDFQTAVAANPGNAEATWHAAACLRRMDRLEESLVFWDRTRELQPRSAATLVGRGMTLYELGRVNDALGVYRAAMALDPKNLNAHWNASWCLLKLGQFEEGWKLFQARLTEQVPPGAAPRRPARKPWNGISDLKGRSLLVTAEAGFGDIIHFCRYIPRAAECGARVILEVPPALEGLLNTMPGVASCIRQGEVLPVADEYCPMLSLPFAFRTTLETIPADVPYLSVDPSKTQEWQHRLGPRVRPRVGIVWSSGVRPNHEDHWRQIRRNLPLEKLSRLKDLDVEFYSLQKGQPAESQLAQALASGWDGPQIVDCADRLHDFADTAALMENLDLIISVCTSTAHLAGALARPTWILLAFDGCWRWLQDRDDSPWYPTVRLYRQETAGDWDGVIDRVRADLASLRL